MHNPINWDNPEDLRRLRNEIEYFKSTALFTEFFQHCEELKNSAINEILDSQPLSDAALYTRESVIGEARHARQMKTFFDDLLERINTTLDQPVDNQNNGQ